MSSLFSSSAVVRLVIGAIYNRTPTPTGITIFSSAGGGTAATSPLAESPLWS
ncbi:hypothetical protein K0M31_016862, partial [Melipona bicolor]